jgi:hypothetical protein
MLLYVVVFAVLRILLYLAQDLSLVMVYLSITLFVVVIIFGDGVWSLAVMCWGSVGKRCFRFLI